MRVIHNERLIPFDVDHTLLMDATPGTPGSITFRDPYDGKMVTRLPHWPHIKLLKNYHARGAEVWVWSKNGVEWARAAIKALKLKKHVHQVSCKPYVHVDDQDASKWMGERVYISPTDSFGQENKE
jgi:hypothetical protein